MFSIYYDLVYCGIDVIPRKTHSTISKGYNYISSQKPYHLEVSMPTVSFAPLFFRVDVVSRNTVNDY